MATKVENKAVSPEDKSAGNLRLPLPKVSRRNFLRLLSFVRPYWWRLGIAGAAMLVVSLTTLVLPAVAGTLIDTVFIKKDGEALNRVALGLVLVFIVQAAAIYFQSYFLSWTGERVVADLRVRVYTHMQKLSLSFYNERRTGELMSRLTNDITLVQNVVTGNVLNLLQSLVTLTGGILLIITKDWRLTLLILVLIPLLTLNAIVFGRRLRKLSKEVQQEIGSSTTVLEETISNEKTVKAFVRENYEVVRYTFSVNQIFSMAVRRARLGATFGAVMTFMTFSTIALVLWFGGNEVLAGNLTPGELVSFLIYMAVVAGPIGQLTGLYTQFQQALGGAERVFELLDTVPAVADLPGAPELPPVAGLVRFENVFFEYDSQTPVLHNLSFEAQPGQVVALVGPSGAGKTTIANLIPRFYDPDAGRITVDGFDIKTVASASLREQIGIVPQEPVLFGVSIRENILYGRLEATEAEVENAARAANAHEFIEKLPQGYATMVGERGVKLSGGQRQRIAIARAVLRNPRILVLDEATSSLDNESESLVQDALDRLMKNRTTVVIAHRLSTIEKAEKIVVIDAGKVLEQGTHVELLQLEGLYYRLYTRNFEEIEEVGAELLNEVQGSSSNRDGLASPEMSLDDKNKPGRSPKAKSLSTTLHTWLQSSSTKPD